MTESFGLKKIQIVGAGFSGLTCAYYLIKAGFEVEIFEKTRRAGGLLNSKQCLYGLVESSANAFLNSDKLQELAQDIQLELLPPLKTARARYIFRGQPTRFPVKVTEILALIKFVFRVLFRKESLAPLGGESIRDWGKRHLSPQLSHYTIEAALQGIYAGEPEHLSASLILKKMFSQSQRVKRMSVSPRNGMGEFVSKLEAYLKNKGVKFVFADGHIDFTKSVVLATPAYESAKILEPIDPLTSTLLAQIEYLPIITANIFFAADKRRLTGFGCLFAPERDQKILGVLMNDCIFANRTKNAISENWIMGGAGIKNKKEFLSLSDHEIVSLALEKRAKLGVGDLSMSDVLDVQITRWEKAFPYYSLDLEKLLQKLKPKKNVFLHGNYLGELGLTKILERSKRLSEEIRLTV